MERSSERLIDVVVLAMLLTFAYLMRELQPGLSGVVIAASIQFWLVKNATQEKTTEPVDIVAQTGEAVNVNDVGENKKS